ncbi:MAG: DUF3536 domain-containing protein [Candidatus Omnitrophica bacterium]|nr:DUF3536 domain-containing protein [Candidatus Omnitrophota bacterium]
MKSFVCIHGHFYQPPRENPWLETIELQESAHPYNDWNERITSECYAPNTASRILDSKENIINIVNNYSKISFNYGPTLLSWMQTAQPYVYHAILKADEMSRENFSGHGAAIAQAYNHMILPLANTRDKHTQVLWGIKDFEFRFKRKPEGMWLPETAVNIESLEVLAAYGLKFTILAPHQAKRVRKIGENEWRDVAAHTVDPQQAYLCSLPSGKSIVLFFYDGPISRDVAFGGLLGNGEAFAGRLKGAFPDKMRSSRLVHIATDGETYGHHHRFGNMALSYCLHSMEEHGEAKISVYGEFLKKHPPQYEVKVVENSSWSCAHGVERWRSDCGCHIGGGPRWTQAWRTPLREALDEVRDELIKIYEKEMEGLCDAPWEVRDAYIDVILDRSRENVDRFLREHVAADLADDQRVKVLKLLEMQRHAMYMYTSCGWFFDDISGIETVQIIQYAARAIQLAREVGAADLEQNFSEKLKEAKSNIHDYRDGQKIYEQQVKPSVIGFLNVAAHYAMSSLFEDYPQDVYIYSYQITAEDYEISRYGNQSLVLGRAVVRSTITWEECEVDFVVLYLGGYNLFGGVRRSVSDNDFNAIREQLDDMFTRHNVSGIVQKMKDNFGMTNYTLWDLFKNEQEKVLSQIFDSTLESIEKHFREIYDHYYPLMQVKPDLQILLPKALSMTIEFILNRDLMDAISSDPLDLTNLERLVREIKRWSFSRDKEMLSYVANQRVEKLMEEFESNPEDHDRVHAIWGFLWVLEILSLDLNVWKAQNIYFAVSNTVYKTMQERADQGDVHAKEWMEDFLRLGQHLRVKSREGEEA